MEPMLLEPVGKDYLWGGIRLKEEYNKDINLNPLAETWECSTHPDGSSIIVNGIHAGESLAYIIEKHPEYLGEKLQKQKELPILIKFIDAYKDLSVQVHPTDEYAWKNEKQNGKTEMWYVLDAEPGAKLVYGFAHNVTEFQIREAVEKGDLSKHLQKISINKGDVFFIPAGLVHAIGKGALIAEIQENSNLTYRLYDYNRLDKKGKKRELHIDKALNVLEMNADRSVLKNNKNIRYEPGCAKELLCRCKYFIVERIQTVTEFCFHVTEEFFQVLLCLEGEGSVICGEDEVVILKKGQCIFLPAALGACIVRGRINLLKIRC